MGPHLIVAALAAAGIIAHVFVGKDGREYVKKGPSSSGRKGRTFWYNGWFK